MYKIFTEYVKQILTDDSGKYSLAKSILSFGMVIASIVLLKLTVTGNLEVEYFLIYMATISGHSNISKYIDSKKV